MLNHFYKQPITKLLKIPMLKYHVKKDILTFTTNAINQFNKIICDKEKYALQLNVKQKKCIGYSYNLFLIEKNNIPHNVETININSLTFCIHQKSIEHIFGKKMDFIDDGFVSEFLFVDPNNINLHNCCKK